MFFEHANRFFSRAPSAELSEGYYILTQLNLFSLPKSSTMAIPWQDHLIQDEYVDLSGYVEDEMKIIPSTHQMKPIGPSIWVVYEEEEVSLNPNEALSDGAKSSKGEMQPTIIVGLPDGAWVWNPYAPWTKKLETEIQARCGSVRHLLVANKRHISSSRLLEWSKANPQAKIYSPPDFDFENDEELDLVFDLVLTDRPFHDYLLDIDQVIFRGSNLDEVVFFHRASETVLFGDFIQRRGNEHEVMSTSTTWLQTFLETVAPASEPTSDEYCTPASWRWSFWWQGEQELARKALDLILNKWSPAQIVLGTSNTIIKEYATDMLERTLGSWIPEAKPYPTDFPVDQQDLGRFQRGTFSTGGGDVYTGETQPRP